MFKEDINQEVISFIKATIIDLQSEELFRRKNALQQIFKKLFPENVTHSLITYQTAFSECHIQILKSFRDKSETCRESSIKLIEKFINILDLNDYYLTYVFPVIVERIGSQELIEESEELRLELVLLLTAIIERYSKTDQLVPFLNDSVLILSQTVTDKYPKVKDASCKCIIKLADALPRHFHMQCESLVKPVLKNFTHQHFRIRVISVQTIGVLILYSTGGTIIETTVTPLAERLFDQSEAVRKAVAVVAAKLLTEYRDRYSHFHRILPLILTGLCDDFPETRKEVEDLWRSCGEQYAKENEKDFKDQLDFPLEPIPHYPKEINRPCFGCRVLVQRNAFKLVPALCSELNSWQADVRLRCAQLLCVLVVHCEENATQGLQDVLPSMYNACEYQRDEEKSVLENVMRAAKFIGVFVPVKSWECLVVAAVRDAPTSGRLRILRSALSGTPADSISTVCTEIADLLSSPAVRCASRKSIYQNELVEICRILLPYPEIASHVFTILVSVVALTLQSNDKTGVEISEIKQKARDLAKMIEHPEVQVGKLVEKLMEKDAMFGNTVSVDRCIFDTLLLEWCEALVPYLTSVGTILTQALNMNCDPEARLKTFHALSTFLQSNTLPKALEIENNKEQVEKFVENLIKEAVLPALVWHAGQTAEALRTAASFCYIQTLHHCPINFITSPIFFNILTTTICLTDDASWRTRRYGARALSQLGKLLNTDQEKIKIWANQASCALVKRLDDPNDNVRMQVLNSLEDVAQNVRVIEPQNLRFLVDSVITHLDDEDVDVKNRVIAILQSVGRENDKYLKEKLQKDKYLFRNAEDCDSLLSFFDSLNIK